eukprot:180191-Rhodomonas_salina.2
MVYSECLQARQVCVMAGGRREEEEGRAARTEVGEIFELNLDTRCAAASQKGPPAASAIAPGYLLEAFKLHIYPRQEDVVESLSLQSAKISARFGLMCGVGLWLRSAASTTYPSSKTPSKAVLVLATLIPIDPAVTEAKQALNAVLELGLVLTLLSHAPYPHCLTTGTMNRDTGHIIPE